MEFISIRAERENYLIEKSVRLNEKNVRIICTLPVPPAYETLLGSNRSTVAVRLRKELRKLEKFPKLCEQLITSFEGLVSLGYIRKMSSLSLAQKLRVESSPLQHYIPLSFAYKTDSISTPA